MITKKEIQQIKEELDFCAKPVFFFGDDQDGLCSFLLLYRYKKEGRGICVKGGHSLGEIMANKAKDYGADKIFVLDLHEIPDEFTDNTILPIVWIDHHGLADVQNKNINYFNPRLHDKNCYIPTSQTCYDVVKQDLWISVIGIIGDYAIPPHLSEFIKKYPKLLEKSYKDPGKLKYETEIGKLVIMFNFLLKGATAKVNTNIKILTRIEDPMELIECKTSRSKFLKKHYERFYAPYLLYFNKAKEIKPEGKLFVYVYEDPSVSITKDLANELSNLHRDLFVVIGRLKDDFYRLSLRYNGDINKFLPQSLQGVNGSIGGHPAAMGGMIHKDSWNLFVKQLGEEVNKA